MGSKTVTPAKAMRLVELETRIEKSAMEINLALLEIKENRLYKATHSSFALYCRERWKMSDDAADRRIRQAIAAKALPPGAKVPPQRSLEKSAQRGETGIEKPSGPEPQSEPEKSKALHLLAPTPEPETRMETCPQCLGSGQVVVVTQQTRASN